MTRLFTAAALLLATGAAAEDYTYAAFETSVAHVDLAACPAPLAAPGVFCRAVAANDGVHVYAFEDGGAQRFAGMASFFDTEVEISFPEAD